MSRSVSIQLPEQQTDARPTWARVATAVLFLVVFLLVLQAPVDMTKADPQGALLTSHAIVHTGHLALDDYPELANPKNYKFREVQGSVFYTLSFGTSVLCVPVVALGELMGQDVLDRETERRWQRTLAALIVAGLFTLALTFFCIRLDFLPALVLAATLVLGTSLASTLGTALWNTGPESLALMGGVLRIARHRMTGRDLSPWLLGTLLGIAYFCRPSAMWPVALIMLYVLLFARRDFWKMLAAAGVWVVLLVGISLRETGEWLPPYYQAVIQEQLWDPWIVLRGLTISPGRGVLVFSPWIVLLLGWALLRLRRQMREPLFWGGLAGFVVHVLMMVRHAHWWGGSCFGARLLTDAVVALAPLLLLAGTEWRRARRSPSNYAVAGVFGVLALFSVWVHVGQGLYEPQTHRWNRSPSIERDPLGAVFDWTYPQFLANEERLRVREREWELRRRDRLAIGTLVDPTNEKLYFARWDVPTIRDGRDTFRRTRTLPAGIGVRLPAVEGDLRLVLVLGSAKPQRVAVSLDGHELGVIRVDSSKPRRFEFLLPPFLLSDPPYLKDGHWIELEIGAIGEVPEGAPRDFVSLWNLGVE